MNIEKFIKDLKSEIENLRYEDEDKRQALRMKLELLSTKLFGEGNKYLGKIQNTSFWATVYPTTETRKRECWNNGKNTYKNIIETIEMDYMWKGDKGQESISKVIEEHIDNRKVFIVHGHDESLKYNVSNWLRSLGIEPIILHETANGGVTTIMGKIERNSNVGCAIVLMTADDKGKANKENDYKKRARQNVVFEAGYFIGKLGAERVIILKESDVDIPGDLLGCVYIEADQYNGWREQVKRELRNIGIKYND